MGTILFAFLALLAGGAEAAFDCGPDFQTYSVSSLNGAKGNGVRCVKFAKNFSGSATGNGFALGSGLAFGWYGEGSWDGVKYRHLGSAEHPSPAKGAAAETNPPGPFLGSAADFSGNGEGTNNIRELKITSSEGAVPATLEVRGGDIAETWQLVSGPHLAYNSVFEESVSICGDKLLQFRAEAPRGEKPGHGIRCMHPHGRIWYGEGKWEHRPYVHLGIRDGAVNGAFGLCHLNGVACSNADWGSLQFTTENAFRTGTSFLVAGAWNERWIPYSTRYALRLHAVRVSDRPKDRRANITPAQVADWLDYTNKVYASAGITVLFDARESGTDWSEFANTEMNNIANDTDPNWLRVLDFGNEVADSNPGKVLVFFRWGAKKIPSGTGFGSSSYRFLLMPGFPNTYICSKQNISLLAHELGHYFGLNHTFAKSFGSLQDAGIFLTYSVSEQVFDGDNLLDTPADPGLNFPSVQCGTATSAVINGVTFAIPRNNIMSYYFSPQHSISEEQRKVIYSTLKSRGL